ncbi:MAG: deoxyribonuclease V [Burkholderiales bacterium]|nr:deoxyribonuclease V [Burkholderiales bacterium]
MKFQQIHTWELSPQEAIDIQNTLKSKVVRSNELGKVSHVAGVDVGFENGAAFAAAAVLNFPSLKLEEYAISRAPATFPYIPGLLSFREMPAVLAALEKLATPPDLILCDGQGIAHPRGFGIACHIGVVTGIASIGVAKTRLIGSHGEVANEKGAWTPLTHKGETVGAVLRTRRGVKPVYISIGHKIDLETAISCVMAAVTKYRLPETTRWAHRLASTKRETSEG